MSLLAAPLPPRAQALKRASRALVDAAGGCEAAADLCRLGKSQLAAAGSVTEPDRWLPLDVVAQLMAVTHGHAGQMAVVQHLAAAAGHALVPVAGAALDPLAAIGRLSKEAADVVAQLVAHQTGTAAPGQIIKECDELLAAVAGIRAAAQVLEREGA
jgi:hypothetical protein